MNIDEPFAEKLWDCGKESRTSTSRKVYIVQGRSWDWEDDAKWIVCGFFTKEKANELAKLAENETQRIFDEKGEVKEGENKYDPKCVIYDDDEGFKYITYEVVIVE